LFKKSIALLLVLLLTFSTAVLGAVPPKDEKEKREVPRSFADANPEYNEKEKVRVIVELEKSPTIKYAQQKGIKYSDLPDSTKENLESDALAKQKEVIAQLNVQKLNVKVLNNFTAVVNGFSTEVEYGKIKLIEGLNNVAKVHVVHEYKRPKVKPEMLYSKELVEAQRAWDEYGYDGEGMVVGVIDTGIDPAHKDMVLSKGTEEKLTKGEVEKVSEENHLPGKFYTEKVPYAYNYMDQNDTILDLGADASMHGMHVSGTVAANGDEANGGIKGVAPNAQILGLKVFGNDPEMPSTYSDIYVKALDDAIKLGADVINMSLGSTAGFVLPDDPEQKAVQNAVDNGVLMAISAGNSAHFGNGFANPNPNNPDIGVSGSPGISYNSLQVASYENDYMDLDAVTYTIDGSKAKAPFLSASTVHPNSIEAKTFDIVYAGLGKPEELAAADVKGKYALIKRGELAFVDKALNAQKAGAVGVIIYNNADGYVNMASDAAITIPQLFLLKSDGDTIEAAIKAGKAVKISFNGDQTKASNPSANKMSAFTSWGVTPNLDFKPEITAPGGQILSTLNNDQYGMMSGTSMAAPHVSGGSAIVLQRVDEEFSLENFERVHMAKNILMNTAKPVIDKGAINEMFGFSIPYSPRRQGAGILQLHAALSTPVVVTEKESEQGKVALREISGDQASFALTAKNFSEEEITYNIGVNVQTDLSLFGELGYNYDELEAQPLEDVGVTINGEETGAITLAAGEEKTIEVELDLTTAKVLNANASDYISPEEVFANGYFVEGFVTLTDTEDTYPEITVPYVGFKGFWDKAPIVDAPMWDENSFYGATGVVDENEDTLGYNQFEKTVNPEHIAFSPNGDGVQEKAIPVISFLRNAKKVEYNVLDKAGNKLRTIRTENHVRKNYYDFAAVPEFSLDPARGWDGKVGNRPAAEGNYFLEVRAVIDFPGAEWQSHKLPIKVDTTKPVISADYNEETRTISFANVTDNETGSGIAYVDVLVDGKSVLEAPLSASTESYTVKELGKTSYLDVVAVDYAGNSTSVNLQDAVDTTIPDIHVLTPEAFGTVDSKEITVSGYINDKAGIKELTVADQKADVAYNAETERNEFSVNIKFDSDGVKRFNVKAVDAKGNEISFQRTVFVDSTAPKLEVTSAPTIVGDNIDKATVDMAIEDNFDEIRAYVNGNEIFYNEYVEPFDMRSFKKTIEGIELNLQKGKNEFIFEVTDLAGHKSSETITIERGSDTSQGSVNFDEKQGTVTLVVDGEKLEDAIHNPDDSSLKIDLSFINDEKFKAFNAELTRSTVNKIAQENKSLIIATDSESITVPAAVLEDLVHSEGKVVFTIEQIASSDVTASEGLNLVTDVLDLTIQVEQDGKQVNVSKFKEPVKVAISVEGKEFADKRKVAAYHLNEETDKWEYAGGKVSGDIFTFSTNHFSKFAVIENNKTFKDVKGIRAQDEIEVLASREIIKGKTADLFSPNEDVTRGQFALLLVRALNIPTSNYNGIFSDLSEKHTGLVLEVEAAHRAGIINGKEDGTFAPHEKITREQMAAMIIRAIEYKDAEVLKNVTPGESFKDSSKISNSFKDYVAVATALGVIQGHVDQTFKPKDFTKRDQSAIVMYRLLDTLNEM
jgi:lactocepin